MFVKIAAVLLFVFSMSVKAQTATEVPKETKKLLVGEGSINFSNKIPGKLKPFPSSLEVHYGIDIVPIQYMDASNLYPGFAISDEGGVQAQPFFQFKYKRFAFEFSENLNPIHRTYKYRGATLGELEIDTKLKLLGKIFPVDTREYSLSIGLGAEYTTIDGHVSMGTFNFPIDHKEWVPVLQISGNFHATECLSFRLNYEERSNLIRVAITDTIDLDSKSYKSLGIGMYLRVFEK